MINKPNRSFSIDFVKGIAAISIVCLHCESQDAIDTCLHLIGRMAVPMFFIITGYYLPSMISTGHLPKHIRKIIMIAIGGLLFYLPLVCIDAYLDGRLLSQLKHVIPLGNEIWEKILFSQYPFNVEAGHLWYLIAIIYILCFIHFYSKKHRIEKLYFLIPILFSVSYIISFFVDEFSGQGRRLYQNFLLIGLPYVLLGSLIREKSINKRFSNKQVGVIIAALTLTYLVEMGFYMYTGLPLHREHYLCIIPLVSFILIWASNNPQFGRNSFITTIGREYSTCIYVVHFYFVPKMYKLFNGSSIESKLQMLTAFALSLLVAFIFIQVKKRFKERRTKV